MSACRTADRVPVLALGALALCLLAGCAGLTEPEPPDPTMIDELRDMCFSAGVDCTEYPAHLLLYLDTVNLPSNNGWLQHLVLSSEQTYPIAGADRLSYSFEGALPPEIDPGILDELGWKLRLSDVRIRYHHECCAEFVSVYGPLDHAEFVFDPSDTLEIYIWPRLGRCHETGGELATE